MTYSLFAFDLPVIALVILISIEAYEIYMHSMKIDSVTYEMREYQIKPRHVRTLLKNPITYYFLALIISSLLAHNNTIAFYNTFRLIQSTAFFLVAVYLFQKRKGMLSYTALTLFLSGIFQSIVALFQFLVQRSLGLDFLGESVLGPDILGVAKFEFAGEKFIRAYGTFPHPNLLGYFLLISLACGLWFALQKNRKKLIPVIAALSGSAVILSGLLLSYSRSVIAAAFFVLLILIVSNYKSILAFYNHFCRFTKIPNFFRGAFAILLFFATLFVLYNLLAPRLCIKKCPGDYSFELRQTYNSYASAIITSHPFFGVGPGNFVPYLKSHHKEMFKPWEFQPAHNIYFLITAEIGIIGLISFLIIVSFAFIRSRFSLTNITNNPFAILLIISLLIGFVDHYQWTLMQGQMLFWLVLALFTTINKQSLFG